MMERLGKQRSAAIGRCYGKRLGAATGLWAASA
jgi:hypothetical protein